MDEITKQEALTEVLSDIEKKKGYVKPVDLVEASRLASSPTHKYFQWDDGVAAEAYRRHQARGLIASVRIEWKGRKADKYWNVEITIEDELRRAYLPLEKVLAEDVLYRQVLASAVSELRYWQRKYKEIQELKEVINHKEIKKVEAALEKKTS